MSLWLASYGSDRREVQTGGRAAGFSEREGGRVQPELVWHDMFGTCI
jgi:hypothetical protein